VTTLHFTVHGLPAAQGSKRHVGNGVMIESSKRVKPWRQDVVAAAVQAAEATQHETFTGAVELRVDFFFARPKSHYGTGGNAGTLKRNAPDFVATRPDCDKLVRSTADALTTAGIWRDDALAARVIATKRYGPRPCAVITIAEVA
jgi:Holliday junction resolvase RusA-like endonuclease